MTDEKGKIDTCATSGCGYRCCQFQQGNYIVLHPGELEEAEASTQSTTHLKIIDDDYHGGKKAICHAKDTSSCDNGFKPLDCVSYPFFPVANPITEEITGFIKGKKCPLQIQHLQNHWEIVRGAWSEVVACNPEVAEWLAKVELVGYTEPVVRDDDEFFLPIVPKRAAAA